MKPREAVVGRPVGRMFMPRSGDPLPLRAADRLSGKRAERPTRAVHHGPRRASSDTWPGKP